MAPEPHKYPSPVPPPLHHSKQPQPLTNLINSSLFYPSLETRRTTQVEDTLEVKEAPGSGKVFAVGDCMDLEVPKTGYLAGAEGAIVAKQVKASAAGKPLKSGKPPVMPISLVPVGKSGGVASMPMGMVMGDYMTKTMKSKDMFASKYWGDLGAGKPPAV